MHIRRSDSKAIIYTVVGFALLSAGAFFVSDTVGILVSLALLLAIILTAGFNFYRMLVFRLRLQTTETHALFNIYSLLPEGVSLPAPYGWSANIHMLEYIVKKIVHSKPKLIVELGSGLSSIYIGHFLKRQGAGALICLEHDAEYAMATQNSIDEHGLGDIVTIVHAPLVMQVIKGETRQWYDTNLIPELTHIDLLIVDGPPWQTDSLARYPALSVFADALSEDAVVILDDSNRADESIIVDKWLKEYTSLSHRTLFSEKGVSVFEVGPSENS